MVFIALSLLTLLFFILNNKKSSKWPSVLLIIAYAIVFSMRDMEVADTEPYYDVYEGLIDPNMEIGYLFLNVVFKSWGFSFSGFLLIIAIFDLLFWYFCTKKALMQSNILIPLLLFMSNMGMIYYGIVLRSGMASSIMLVPITYVILSYETISSSLSINLLNLSKHVKLFLLFGVGLFFAGLFHQSAYIVIVALALYYIPLTKKWQHIFLILALVIGSIPSAPHYISSIVQPILLGGDLRMSGRFDREIVHGLSYYQIINVIIGLLYIYMAKYIENSVKQKQYQFILNLYVVGVFMSGAFSFLVAGARIGHLLIFYEFFLPAILMNNITNKAIQKKVFITFVVIVIINFARNFYGTPSLIDYLK